MGKLRLNIKQKTTNFTDYQWFRAVYSHNILCLVYAVNYGSFFVSIYHHPVAPQDYELLCYDLSWNINYLLNT